MPTGGLRTAPFSRESLSQELDCERDDHEVSHTVEYLAAYLAYLDASSMLVEEHYIDRHYLEEFSQYYARSFNAPQPWCTRVHFFKQFDATQLDAAFDGAYASVEARAAAENALRPHYLGYVVRRPLPHASVGRTVLKTYPVEGRRHYDVVRPYEVNVCGLDLRVDGLAYQQQDGGAAVCASTSLWSALQQVAHLAGHRTPTPHAITEAARSPFPASTGLDMRQMATALSNLGYGADVLTPSTNRAAFRALLVTCIASRLPVILLIAKKEPTGAGTDAGEITPGHAVCITGYSDPQTIIEVPPQRLAEPPVRPIRSRDASLEIIYVHDDNLGSHAHYELFDSDERNEQGQRKLMLRRGRSNHPAVDWWTVDQWEVYAALVPKPSNLRAAIDDVFHDALYVRPLVEALLPGLELHYSARIESGVEYKRSLFGRNLNRNLLRGFVEALTLPRYVGVVSVHDSVSHLLDVLLDVSEIRRTKDPTSMLGIVAPGVAFQSRAWVGITNFCRRFRLPSITGPASP